jgi:CelD/BcsL family acetyltransferase involved in cellulose biosynthesis
MTLHVELTEGFGDDALIAEWDALLARDPAATLFQSARYLRRWDEVLGGQRSLRVRTFRRDGALVALVPETRELLRLPSGPQELVTFAGGSEVTDYLGPVCAPQDRAEVAAAYIASLAADRAWDEVVLGGLAEDTGWHTLLGAEAAGRGLTVTDVEVDDVCPRVDLSGGLDAYLQRLPGRLRQEVLRKARKLTRDVAPYEVITLRAAELHDGIDAFLEQAAQDDSEKAGFFRRDDMRRWFHTLVDEYGADGTLRLHRLDVGGLPAAMTVSFLWGDTWGLYNSSFDPTLGALAPGVVLVWELIGLAADEGLAVFDLLRGDEPYKYRFGAVDRPLHTLSLVRR